MTPRAALFALVVYLAVIGTGIALERLGVGAELLARLVAVPIALARVFAAFTQATLDEGRYLTGGPGISAPTAATGIVLQAIATVMVVFIMFSPGQTGDPVALALLAIGAGVFLAGLLLAPTLQYNPAPTLAGALANRHPSSLLGLLCALCILAISLSLATMMIHVAIMIAAPLLAIDVTMLATAMLVAMLLAAVPGGMRFQVRLQPAILMAITLGLLVAAIVIFAGNSPVYMTEITRMLAGIPGLQFPGGLETLGENLIAFALIVAAIVCLPSIPAFLSSSPDSDMRSLPLLGIALAMPALAASLIVFAKFGDDWWNDTAWTTTGLPLIFQTLIAASCIMAALSVAMTLLLAGANSIGDDVYRKPMGHRGPTGERLVVYRGMLIVMAFIATFAAAGPDDPRRLLAWTFWPAVAGLFPVIALAGWRSMNAFGALAGLVAGSTITLAGMAVPDLAVIAPSDGNGWNVAAPAMGIASGVAASVLFAVLFTKRAGTSSS